VLVTGGGQPKVLDFGIARAVGNDMPRLTVQTAHGQLMGTLAYMSPEQLRGRSEEVDGRSDVYALGVLLYRLLADRAPFDIGDLTWPEAIQRVLESEPVPLGDVQPALRGPLEQIAACAMSRDLSGRYQTAAELAADLQRFLDGRPLADANPPATVPVDRWPIDVHGVRALAGSPDGQFVALGLASGSIELRDVTTGSLLESFGGDGVAVAALTFATTGRIVAAWDDGRVAAITLHASRL
jgi:serine/threonine protein kinase